MKRIIKYGKKNESQQTKITDAINQLYLFDKDIKPESKKKKCGKIFLKIIFFIISSLYSGFVLAIIFWPFIYAIVLSSIHAELEYVFIQVFTLVYVAQFVTGYVYYNSSGYDDMIRRNHKHNKIIVVLLCIGFIISLILAVIMIVLISLQLKSDIYNEFVNDKTIVQKVFFYILVFLTLFYSYNIFISNLIIFSVILVIHCLELRTYEKMFNDFVLDFHKEISLASIIQDYNLLKNINNKSVNDLNNMFSSMTIIGGIGVYFLILLYAFHTYSVAHYVDIVIYSVVEVIYFYTIYSLRKHVQNIVSLGTSPKFMNRFLSKTKFYNFKGDEIEESSVSINLDVINSSVNTIKDMLMRVMIRSNEGSNSLDWLILNAIFNEQWEYFQLFGFDINDATFIKKILWIVIGYIFLSQFQTYWGINLNNNY